MKLGKLVLVGALALGGLTAVGTITHLPHQQTQYNMQYCHMTTGGLLTQVSYMSGLNQCPLSTKSI